jgi:hypothetical protein
MTDSVNRTIDKETLDKLWEANLLKCGVDDNGDINVIYVDADGNQRVSQTLDFVADIEVDGIPVTPDCGDITTATTTTVEAVGALDRAKVYAVSLSSTDGTDLAGTVTVKIGSVQIAPKVAAIKGGGAHWVLPRDGNYIHGALGDDITIVTDTAENLSYAVYHEVYTPA